MRTEFGYWRSVCDCRLCRLNCEVMPGFLIPADLTRMIPLECNKCHRPMKGSTAWDGACECGGLIQTVDPFRWAEENLLASLGALVLIDGEPIRIPTLVPATKSDGSCIHLTALGMCNIHADSPFGCAFFKGCETQMPPGLLEQGLSAVADEMQDPRTLYFQLWIHLSYKNKESEPPELLREKMKQRL